MNKKIVSKTLKKNFRIPDTGHLTIESELTRAMQMRGHFLMTVLEFESDSNETKNQKFSLPLI